MASATSATTSVRDAECLAALPPRSRPPSFNVWETPARLARSAGNAPKRTAVRRVTPNREEHRAVVERYRTRSQQRGPGGRREQTEHPGSEQDAQCASDEREEGAFAERSAEEPASRGAERGADRDVALAAVCAREEKVRHVRAGDEEQERDGSHEQQDLSAGAAGDSLRDFDQQDSVVRTALVAEAGRRALDFGFGAREGHSGSEARNDGQVVLSPR